MTPPLHRSCPAREPQRRAAQPGVRPRHRGQPVFAEIRMRRLRWWSAPPLPRRALSGAAWPGTPSTWRAASHHAMRAGASGFCVYNDPVIAIKWLLANGADRIGYVDLDVHHGDGVLAAFYADPRVLTISMHEHPRTLFPGTGLPAETGSGAGAGYAVNVALPAGTSAMRSGRGCSMRLSRRCGCCGYSGRRCWSASTAVTVTGGPAGPFRSERGRDEGRIRRGAPAGARDRGRALGAYRRVAGTRWCRWCPERGFICLPKQQASRSTAARRHRRLGSMPRRGPVSPRRNG